MDAKSDKGPEMTLSKPVVGFVTLRVNDLTIPGISYINPYLIDDLADFLEAALAPRDCTVRFDRENLGMAYLTVTECQELLVVCDSGTSMTDMFRNGDDVRKCANMLADSVLENLEDWAGWVEDEEIGHDEAIEVIRRATKRLKNL